MSIIYRRRVFVSFALLFAFCFIFGFFIRHNPDALQYFSKLTVSGLFLVNGLSLFFGFPLSSIFDILIFTQLGVKYLIIAPIFVSVISILQILCMRHFFDLSRISFFSRSSSLLTTSSSFVYKPVLFIFLLRSIPIAPFIVSSFIISNFNSVSIFHTFLLSLAGLTRYYLYLYSFILAGKLF